MHDFIQSLSFQAQQQSPAMSRSATEALRSVMRSFDSDVPFTAYRPFPAARPAGRNPKRRRAALPLNQ